MSNSNPNAPVAKRPVRKIPKSGNYFTIHLPTIQALIDRGMDADDLLVYYVLAAGTDASNSLTRSGRLAVANSLNIGRYAAAQAVARLLSIGAIASLEDELVNRRDPTASRFQLQQFDTTSFSESDDVDAVKQPSIAHFANAMVQDKAHAANLCRAVRLGGMPVLLTLMRIATDPAQIKWPPTLYADVDVQPVGRLGSKALVRFDLPSGLADPSRIRFNEAQSEVLLLAELGLINLDIYTVARARATGELIMIEPVGTIRHGSILQNGPFAGTATLALLADRILTAGAGTLPEYEPLLAELRHSQHMVALLASSMPEAHVILRPRLATLPRSSEAVDAERRLNTAGKAASDQYLRLFSQHFPDQLLRAAILINSLGT